MSEIEFSDFIEFYSTLGECLSFSCFLYLHRKQWRISVRIHACVSQNVYFNDLLQYLWDPHVVLTH